MSKITFMPMNQTVQIEAGETILETAIRHDIPLQHACGGFCACTTCHIIVKQGAGSLSEIDDDEEERLDRAIGVNLHSRLGCQAKLTGQEDLVVEILNEGHGH